MKQTAKELNQEISNRLDTLAKLTDNAKITEEMKQFMKMMSVFHNYSFGNLCLIRAQSPDATRVAGYQTWKKLGRYVMRGEKGIRILAPCFYNVEDEDGNESKKLYFKVVSVFDVSQTDGKELPEEPDWKSPERQKELENSLLDYCKHLKINVSRKDLAGDTQGYSAGGKIVLDEKAGTKTLIHELAHELLHQKKDKTQLSRQQEEVEAEAVSYVVADFFGVGGVQSPNYLALWDADREKIKSSQERIQKTLQPWRI